MKYPNNKLYSSMDYSANNELFFSLVDYRNNYFISSDPKKIIEFYKGFENREQLIQWMTERPKGTYTIYEVDGNKNVIVVIPTADFNGKYAKECRDNIFKGLHIIFVESGVGNYYFNFAHNMNAGIRKAMEYNPKWVVYSNDDMYKIDDNSVLTAELSEISEQAVDVIFTQHSKYHSHPKIVGKPNFLYKFYLFFNEKSAINNRLLQRFGIIHYVNVKNFKTSVVYKQILSFLNYGSFGIFSGCFLRKINLQLFDETFINNAEESDRSIEMALNGSRFVTINYRIGDLVGSTIGNNFDRVLRSVASEVYFDNKFKEYILVQRGHSITDVTNKR